MKRLPEAVTTKLSELFTALHSATDDLKMAGAESCLIGDFSQVTVINDSCRKLQALEAEIKTTLKNFESSYKARSQEKTSLHQMGNYRTRKPSSRLSVKVADTFVEEITIAETFVKALRVFGLERVAKLSKVVSSAPLIARTPVTGYQTQKRCDGWYITTHVSKRTAITVLEAIGRQLNIPVKVVFVER